MKLRSLALLFCAMVLATATGCVKESTDGSAKVFTYELWVPGVVLLLGIVAAPLGLLLRSRSSRFGWAFLVLGPLSAILMAPSLFRERIVLDRDTYTVRSGLWGMTHVHAIDLNKLRQVRLTVEESRGRRGRKSKNHYMICEFQDGTQSKVSVSNDVARAGRTHFLKQVSDRGIPVIDQQL